MKCVHTPQERRAFVSSTGRRLTKCLTPFHETRNKIFLSRPLFFPPCHFCLSVSPSGGVISLWQPPKLFRIGGVPYLEWICVYCWENIPQFDLCLILPGTEQLVHAPGKKLASTGAGGAGDHRGFRSPVGGGRGGEEDVDEEEEEDLSPYKKKRGDRRGGGDGSVSNRGRRRGGGGGGAGGLFSECVFFTYKRKCKLKDSDQEAIHPIGITSIKFNLIEPTKSQVYTADEKVCQHTYMETRGVFIHLGVLYLLRNFSVQAWLVHHTTPLCALSEAAYTCPGMCGCTYVWQCMQVCAYM